MVVAHHADSNRTMLLWSDRMAALIYAGDAGIFKTCTKCDETKSFEEFALHKHSPDGRRPACKACNSEHEAAKRRRSGTPQLGLPMACERCGVETIRTSVSKKFCDECASAVRRENATIRNARYEAKRTEPRKRDKPIDRDRRKRWAAENQDKIRAAWQAYNDANRDEINRKAREFNKTPERREWRIAYEREYFSEPKRRLDRRMKAAISQALNGRKAGRSWEALVGYGVDELAEHIEKQFLPGMTWDNIGRWHIDHIVPKVAFDYEDDSSDEFRACWSLTNLRPLWAADNISKGGKRLHLI